MEKTIKYYEGTEEFGQLILEELEQDYNIIDVVEHETPDKLIRVSWEIHLESKSEFSVPYEDYDHDIITEDDWE